jgi:hypothetical protein
MQRSIFVRVAGRRLHRILVRLWILHGRLVRFDRLRPRGSYGFAWHVYKRIKVQCVPKLLSAEVHSPRMTD